MDPKYLMKTDVQLNPNILRTKNDKRVLSKALDIQRKANAKQL